MKKIRTIAIFNTIVFFIANVISYLSNTKVFSNKTIGDVSDKYESLFVPTGFTFAIWGVIYASLYAFVIYHLIKAFKRNADHQANKDIQKMGWLFSINNVATTAWVIAWTKEMLIISVILMIIQLLTLISINIRLHIFAPYRSLASKAFTQFPLAIYFAWICIATIANISSVLVGLGWNGGGISPVLWTVILIAVAVLLALFIVLIRRNLFFGLVVIWALYGIIYKRSHADVIYENILLACWAAIFVIAVAIIMQAVKNVKLTADNSVTD